MCTVEPSTHPGKRRVSQAGSQTNPACFRCFLAAFDCTCRYFCFASHTTTVVSSNTEISEYSCTVVSSVIDDGIRFSCVLLLFHFSSSRCISNSRQGPALLGGPLYDDFHSTRVTRPLQSFLCERPVRSWDRAQLGSLDLSYTMVKDGCASNMVPQSHSQKSSSLHITRGAIVLRVEHEKSGRCSSSGMPSRAA
jgi:hypothetical protein